MAIPAGYKSTVAGVIPSDWDVRTIGDEFDVSAGGDWDPENSSKIQSKEFPYPVYANALTNNAVQGYCRYCTVPGDSFTITGRGDVGKAVYRPEPFVPIVRLLALVPKRASSKFYAEYINSRHRFALESTGVPQLTAPQVRPQHVAVPPIREQRAIADALTDAEDFIVALERLIAKKRAIKKGVIQQLVTGKSRLPGFDGPWGQAKLGALLKRPPRYGVNAAAVPNIVGAYTYIRITDIDDTGRFAPRPKVGVLHANSADYVLRSGELVFARTGASVGKSYLYDPRDGVLVYAGFLINIAPDEKVLEPAYLALHVQTASYWTWVARTSVRSGQPGINGREYAQLQLALPDIREQRAIADSVQDIETEIRVLCERLDKARAVKQGMMQELLTGRTRLPVTEAVA